MDAFTYLIIGYVFGCLAASIATYWAMLVHIRQHYTRNRTCEIYTITESK